MEFGQNNLVKSDQTWLQQILASEGEISVETALNQLPLNGVRIEPAKSPRDSTPLEIRGTAYLSPIVTAPVPVRVNMNGLGQTAPTFGPFPTSSTSLPPIAQSNNAVVSTKANSRSGSGQSKAGLTGQTGQTSRPSQPNQSTKSNGLKPSSVNGSTKNSVVNTVNNSVNNTVNNSRAESLRNISRRPSVSPGQSIQTQSTRSQPNRTKPSSGKVSERHSSRSNPDNQLVSPGTPKLLNSVTATTATLAAAAEKLANYSARSNVDYFIPSTPSVPNMPGAIRIPSARDSESLRDSPKNFSRSTKSSVRPSVNASRVGSSSSQVSISLKRVDDPQQPPNQISSLPPLPREVALSPRKLSPEEEYDQLISVNNQIALLINENKRINLIHPDALNIVGLRQRQDYLNKLIRRVKVTRFQRKNRRWFYLVCLVVELWLSKVLGVDVSSYLEDQLDSREEYDAIIYEIGEEMVPHREGQKSSAMYRLFYNSAVSLIIVGVLNFVMSWARSYLPVDSGLLKSGKDVLKRLIKDDDNLFEDDTTLKNIVQVVSEIKDGNYLKILQNPTLAPILGQLMTLIPGLAGAPGPAPTASNVPGVNQGGNQGFNYGSNPGLNPGVNPGQSANWFNPAPNVPTPGATPVRYYM